MKIRESFDSLFNVPWAIRPETLQALFSFVLSEKENSESSLLSAFHLQEQKSLAVSGIAVLPLVGILSPRESFFSATSLDWFSSTFLQALRDPNVLAIVLDVDSPGGSVFGVDELSERIFESRKIKPVVAVANNIMASAAYWIASAAEKVFVSPSGLVGSVGVIAHHEEFSEQLKMMGVGIETVVAGKFKDEMSPLRPLELSAREHLQNQVDSYYSMFLKAVARNRGVSVSDVRGGYGEGRVLTSGAARASGLVDRVQTLQATLDGLSARVGAGAERARLRARLQAAEA